uniref:Uncharacterized protein n=1 Tax=Arundo donax TaxID=35708 RepID=A0A0A9CFL0_ARUDO
MDQKNQVCTHSQKQIHKKSESKFVSTYKQTHKIYLSVKKQRNIEITILFTASYAQSFVTRTHQETLAIN